MTKVHVSNLNGTALNWAVKQSKGLELGFEKTSTWNPSWKPTFYRPDDEVITYSVRELPGVTVHHVASSDGREWRAIKDGVAGEMYAHLPELAVLRCFVACQMGFELDVPEEVLAQLVDIENSTVAGLSGSDLDRAVAAIRSESSSGNAASNKGGDDARRHFYVQGVLKSPRMVAALLADYELSHAMGEHGDETIEQFISRCAEQDFDDGQDGCLFQSLYQESLSLSSAQLEVVDPQLAEPLQVADGSTLVHAAYLWAGYIKSGMLSSKLSNAFGGQIGAAFHVTGFANTVATALREADALNFEYPGVFDYEVTEGLGEWLRANPGAGEKEFSIELVQRTEQFFERDCSPLAKVLLPAELVSPPVKPITPGAASVSSPAP